MSAPLATRKVGNVKPAYSKFNLSHSNLIDATFGKLYPVEVFETLPGDTFKLPVSVVGRLTSALKSPILAEMDICLEAFYCPTRILMGSDANFETPVGERRFEEFLVGGINGDEDILLPQVGPSFESGLDFKYGGIGDYLGIQPGVRIASEDRPLAFAHRMYRFIWNEFYRAEFLQDPVQVCQYLGNGLSSDNTLISSYEYDSLLSRGWRRDRFTSALPWQQFGTSPAFDISGVLPLQQIGDTARLGFASMGGAGLKFDSSFDKVSTFATKAKDNYLIKDLGVLVEGTEGGRIRDVVTGSSYFGVYGDEYISNFGVDLRNAVTFNINDIRTNFQIQKWMERNVRSGIRMTEYLQAHFNCSPSDGRLQRPQFIGSYRLPWIVSEVLQTSQDGATPQGNQAGQAIVLGSGNLGRFRSLEYGYIMILASVVPKPQYQQGLPRWMSRKHKLDMYSPEFAHLSEEAVLNKEIYISGDSAIDNGVFGFQPIWDEFRYIPNRVSNHMRSNATGYSFDYWHQARLFAETPELDGDFLTIGGTEAAMAELMRVFAVQNENPFILNIGFNVTANRPLPFTGEPGLVDHF